MINLRYKYLSNIYTYIHHKFIYIFPDTNIKKKFFFIGELYIYYIKGISMEKDNKKKENEFLDSLIPPDIRTKQIFLGELYKNDYFGEAAIINLEKCQKYKSPVTIKCKTDVTIRAINIFDIVGLLPDFFTINKYFDIAKKDAQNLYYKQKEESHWVKIKEHELSVILKEQSGNCLKQYTIKRN